MLQGLGKPSRETQGWCYGCYVFYSRTSTDDTVQKGWKWRTCLDVMCSKMAFAAGHLSHTAQHRQQLHECCTHGWWWGSKSCTRSHTKRIHRHTNAIFLMFWSCGRWGPPTYGASCTHFSTHLTLLGDTTTGLNKISQYILAPVIFDTHIAGKLLSSLHHHRHLFLDLLLQ